MALFDFTDRTVQFACEEPDFGDFLVDDSGNGNDMNDAGGNTSVTGHVGLGRGQLRSGPGNEFFSKAFSAGNEYDIRGQTDCTFTGWIKLHNVEQPAFFSIHDAILASGQALFIDGRSTAPTQPGPRVIMHDGISVGAGVALFINDAVAIAQEVWQFIAGGYDATRNKLFGYWGRAIGESFYNEVDGVAAGFGYSGVSSDTALGFWNSEAGLANISIDHILWWNGRALTEAELDIIWNNHVGINFATLSGDTEEDAATPYNYYWSSRRRRA
jgi:hypothetical protein